MSASNWVYLVVGVLGGGGVSGLGGYLLSGRNERLRDQRSADRAQQALRDRQRDEARVFQRDTLLELHDALYKLNRATGRANHVDEMQYRQTGRYGRDPLPEDLSNRFTELLTSVHRLRVRVFNDGLRDVVEQYTDSLLRGTPFGVRKDGDDAEWHTRAQREQISSLDRYGELEEMLGTMIRSQFPEK